MQSEQLTNTMNYIHKCISTIELVIETLIYKIESHVSAFSTFKQIISYYSKMGTNRKMNLGFLLGKQLINDTVKEHAPDTN